MYALHRSTAVSPEAPTHRSSGARRRTMIARLLGAGLFALLVACRAEPPAPAASGTHAFERVSDARLEVSVDADSVYVDNRSETPLALLLLERDYARRALAIWGYCPEFAQCGVAPGARRAFAIAEIMGYRPGEPQTILVMSVRVADPAAVPLTLSDPAELEVPLAP